MFKIFMSIVLLGLSTLSATAQENFWVQIEARQTLTSAQERARAYAAATDGVNGFYLGDGFYGIFIGPFSQQNAEAALENLLGIGIIPSDSFVKNGQFFQQQFWPIGGRATTPDTATPTLPAPPDQPVSPSMEVDETVDQALASERLLTRPQKEDIQKALAWAGHYTASIDGSFGRGTRTAMEAWQQANGVDPTGIMTTWQRETLFEQYNSILETAQMRLVRDAASGIQMQVPTGLVAFTDYKPPFVRFDASADLPQAQVLFISQAGDAGRLVGLYEIMQVLDIVPTDGPRTLTATGFEIEGIDDRLHSYTMATLEDGTIKGFTVVWPINDDARRVRIIETMKASFTRLDGVLDPLIVPAGDDQSIDMVSGLAVRQPDRARSGFYVSDDGAVVTTIEAVGDCQRVTYDSQYDAEVVAVDDALGIAILRPVAPMSPIDTASFQQGTPRLQDQIAVGGYPYNGVLSAPTLTFGQVLDIRSLTGDDRLIRLSILPQPSDAGGPVFDKTGAVLGMLLPRIDGTTQVLPPEVNFAIDAAQITALMESNGIALKPTSQSVVDISPVALTRHATDITVLVSCW